MNLKLKNLNLLTDLFRESLITISFQFTFHHNPFIWHSVPWNTAALLRKRHGSFQRNKFCCWCRIQPPALLHLTAFNLVSGWAYAIGTVVLATGLHYQLILMFGDSDPSVPSIIGRWKLHAQSIRTTQSGKASPWKHPHCPIPQILIMCVQ
jgi:hypothetical protein